MALEIGRQGYLGLAVEATSGTPESTPSTFLPFTENSLQDKHEPLMDISSRASRVADFDAVTGKKWGEGDVGIYLDGTQSGYLFKLAFGNEASTLVPPSANVYDHLFYLTTSGNTPKSATLWNFRGDSPSLSVRRHAFACVDQLELEVNNEDLATLTASFITGFPATATAPTLTTVSGTVFTWKDMTVQFGANFNAALSATATKLTSFSMQLANNVEAIYRSGNNEPDTFAMGEAQVTGEYSLFLESDAEIDAYRNLDKRCMVVTLTGAGLGNGLTERLRIVIHRMILEDHEPETDLDGFFAINQTFKAIQGSPLNPGYVDITLRNAKTSVY